jgi:hypothetical protein
MKTPIYLTYGNLATVFYFSNNCRIYNEHIKKFTLNLHYLNILYIFFIHIFYIIVYPSKKKTKPYKSASFSILFEPLHQRRKRANHYPSSSRRSEIMLFRSNGCSRNIKMNPRRIFRKFTEKRTAHNRMSFSSW